MVVFPLLRTSRQAPAATAQAIGEWLTANCPEISGFNAVQGFLNLSLSNIYWREALENVIADADFGRLPQTGRRRRKERAPLPAQGSYKESFS